ncbi:MAG: hypothetical protein H7A47_09005 [Verrucomicrobiales bacterium]|nr:hypothetical protein [Verrucomicrobiales bacterium]
MSELRSETAAILYCHCHYARVLPPDVKATVLQELCAADVAFEAVPDLCELSARRDPSLKRLANGGPVKIAACFPRAVKWLFAAAGAPLSKEHTEVLNMRTESPEQLVAGLLSRPIQPNLPPDGGGTDTAQPEPESA